MDLLDLLDMPRADVMNLVKAIRSGNLWNAIDPGLALVLWLRGKLGSTPLPLVVGDSEPLTDDGVADQLEAIVLCHSAKQDGATVVGAVPVSGMLMSFVLPWLLNLLARAVIGGKPS